MGLAGYVGMICQRELWHRHNKLRGRRSADEPRLVTLESPEDVAVAKDTASRLEAHLLEVLSDRDLLVMRMCYRDGRANTDIARTLGVKSGTVDVALHRIRGRCKSFLASPQTGGSSV